MTYTNDIKKLSELVSEPAGKLRDVVKTSRLAYAQQSSNVIPRSAQACVGRWNGVFEPGGP